MAACLGAAVFCLPFAKAAIEAFVWLAVFVWLLKRALGFRSDAVFGMLPRTEMNRALGVLAAACVLSTLFSVDHGLSLRGLFGKELKFLAIYFILAEVIIDKKRLGVILGMMVASAALMIADAGAQYFGGRDFLRGLPLWGGGSRLTASFSFPNAFAGWLAPMIPLFTGLTVLELPKKKILRPLLLAGIACLIAALVLTYSRGAWLGVAAGLTLMAGYAVLKAHRKLKIVIITVLACLGLLYLLLPQPVRSTIKAKGRFDEVGPLAKQTFGVLTQKDGVSESVRVNYLKESLQIIKDYPVFGCGLNTYTKVVQRYKLLETSGAYPHNSFLQKTAETGLVGLGAFLGVLAVFFKTGFSYLGRQRDPLVLGLLAGTFAFCVHSFFDNHLYSLQLAVLFWFLLGLTGAVLRIMGVKT